MFKSLEWSDYKNETYLYKLIDDEFEIEFRANGLVVRFFEEYKKRNLNVARNFAIFIYWAHIKYNESIDYLVAIGRSSPYYVEYEKEIEKYLQLM